jgi:hypothetical protein
MKEIKKQTLPDDTRSMENTTTPMEITLGEISKP